MTDAGYHILSDLPLQNNKIDHKIIWNKLNKLNKSSLDVFLVCYSLQNKFASLFHTSSTAGCHLLHPELVTQAKSLLITASSQMLSLAKWDLFFGCMPSSKPEKQMIFQRMLHRCKISKFREVNFKLLVHILLSLKVLLKVWNIPRMAKCPWCGEISNIEHMMFVCWIVCGVRSSFVWDNFDLLGKWGDSD